MTDRGPWSLAGEELALVRYVRPAEVARHVQLPGRSGESRLARLRAVYATLAAKEIGYAYAAPGAEDGMQVIRPPEQVLWALKHATCLDLAVVLAGACLTAELHPVIVILDPASGTGVGHSLVLVRLDHDLQPRTDGLFDLDVWRQLPEELCDELQHSLDGPDGEVLAIDPIALAVSLGTSATPGLHVDLTSAVTNGAAYLTSGTWRLGVDVGSAWRDTHEPLASLPTSEPLREPYRAPDTAASPLRLLRAEYGLVGFQSRDAHRAPRLVPASGRRGQHRAGRRHRHRRGRQDPARARAGPAAAPRRLVRRPPAEGRNGRQVARQRRVAGAGGA